MFLDVLELLKRDPRKGSVGIDLIIIPLPKGARAFVDAAIGRLLVLVNV